MCCLHQVFKADRGSHHICSTTDDLEGKIILGAALLVPTLVPGQLVTCEGGVELKVKPLAPWGDTGHVPEGLSGADTRIQWPTKGATPRSTSCIKEACPGAGTSCLFEVYGAKAGCCSRCDTRVCARSIWSWCPRQAPWGFSAWSFPILGQDRDPPETPLLCAVAKSPVFGRVGFLPQGRGS